MASNKPLPDTDDDIIDLTDLVEVGTDDGKTGDNGVDMSFEQELDDLFGDAEPLPSKTPPAAAESAESTESGDDDDLFDLAGFEVADEPEAPAAKTPPADDDAMDLAGLGFDDAGDDDPLAGLGLDDDKAPAKAAPAADDLDISDVSFDDLGLDDTPRDKDASDSLDALDFGDLEEKSAAAAPDATEEPMDLADLDFETAASGDAHSDEPAAVAAILADVETDEAKAVTDADLDALLAEPDAEQAIPDLLGALPDEPEDVPDLLGTLPDESEDATGKDLPRDSLPDDDDLTDFAALPDDSPADEAIPVAAAAAVAAAVLPAMAASGSARTATGPSVGGIDLGALDSLIDSSKAPAPEAADTPAPDKALAARLEALEDATAKLAGRLDELPEPPDENSLAVALASRLENALTLRVESLLAKHEAGPDLDSLKADILADVNASLEANREALLADLPAAPAPSGDLDAGIDSLHQAVSRLEALTQDRHSQFKDFADTMETRLAELRRELPDPEDFVTGKRLDEALSDLRDSLADNIAASLDQRLEAISDAARQAAREEVQTLGEALESRLQRLENDRIDPEEFVTGKRLDEALDNLRASLADNAQAAATQDALETLKLRLDALQAEQPDPDALAEILRQTLLAETVDPKALEQVATTAQQAEATAQKALESRVSPADLDAALDKLRQSLSAELETAVPKAAAAVIREEIAALLQELG